MSEEILINVKVLDEIIIGRVEPRIYAFTTETVPNYLKVGDTYRPLEIRLAEWKKYFPNLEKKFEAVAKVNNETFFRDYAVHFFLENELKRSRLKPNALKGIPYYSNEFFENATDEDIYLDEFKDEIDEWVINAIKGIGIDTAKGVLNAPREMLIEKADLEENTVDDVLRILRAEFEE